MEDQSHTAAGESVAVITEWSLLTSTSPSRSSFTIELFLNQCPIKWSCLFLTFVNISLFSPSLLNTFFGVFLSSSLCQLRPFQRPIPSAFPLGHLKIKFKIHHTYIRLYISMVVLPLPHPCQHFSYFLFFSVYGIGIF